MLEHLIMYESYNEHIHSIQLYWWNTAGLSFIVNFMWQKVYVQLRESAIFELILMKICYRAEKNPTVPK